MSGFVVACGRCDRQAIRRISGWTRWTRSCLGEAALVALGCAILGVFAAAQLRIGNDATRTWIALNLALLVIWLAAIWLAGGLDDVTAADPTPRHAEIWSFALRPADQAEDPLWPGSEVGRGSTDFCR
jgi:hypothetical protein